MKTVLYLRILLFTGNWVLLYSSVIAQTKRDTWDGLSFYSQRIAKLSDPNLRMEIEKNNIWANISKEEINLKVQRLNILREEAIKRQKNALFLGEFILETPREAWAPIKTIIGKFNSDNKKGILGPITKKVDIVSKAEDVYRELPKDSKDIVYENAFKYFDADYYRQIKYKEYDQMIISTMPTVIGAAKQNFRRRPNDKILNTFTNSLNNKHYKEQVELSIKENQSKSPRTTTPFSKATEKIKNLDKSVNEHVDVKIDVNAEAILNYENSYYTARLYKRDFENIKSQIVDVKRQLRSANLSINEINQKQEQLKKLVLHMDITYSGFMNSTSERLGNIEGKLNQQDKKFEQVLAEINLRDSPLEQRINDLKQMLELGVNSPIPIEKVNQYLKRDELLLKKQNFEVGIEVANKALAIGGTALNLMEKYNIGTPFIRKFVKTALDISKVGVSVAAGFATGGPVGAVIGGIGALLGIGGGGPSPEYQMLERIDERLGTLEKNMFQAFTELDRKIIENIKLSENLISRLQYLQSDITNMRIEMIKNHQDIVVELSYINLKLDGILSQIYNVDDKIISLLSKDIEQCYGPYERLIAFKNVSPIETQSIASLNSFSNANNCQTCLQGILDVFNKDFINGGYNSMFDYQIGKEERDAVFKNKERYYTKADLYDELIPYWNSRWTNSTNLDIATYSMTFPTAKATEHLQSYEKLLAAKPIFSPDIHIRYQETYSNQKYLNFKKIAKFANYVADFYPFLEFYSVEDKRLLLPAEISRQKDFIAFRNDMLERQGLLPLLRLIDKAIAQQSLMMGTMLYDTFYKVLQTKDMTPVKLNGPEMKLFKLLESDSLLARNFSSYLVSTVVKNSDFFNQKLKKYDNGLNASFSLQDLVNPKDANWFYIESSPNGLYVCIQKTFFIVDGNSETQGASIRKINIPLVQNLKTTYDVNNRIKGFDEEYVVDEIIPTEGFLELNMARNRIQALLIEVNLIKNAIKNLDSEKVDELTKSDIDFVLYYNEILNQAYKGK